MPRKLGYRTPRQTSKQCNHCGKVKPASDFYAKRHRLRPYCKGCWREREHLRKYGLTMAEYRALPKLCGICGTTKLLRLDHSHRSGMVRGWLCARCNLLVGILEKNPKWIKPAIAYIRGHREVH
jgi:hypothetical protein